MKISIKTLLLETFVSLVKLATAFVIFVLFFLWYPDFVGWFASKLPTASGLLGIIPACVFVGGITFGILFNYLSISNWRDLQETTEVEA